MFFWFFNFIYFPGRCPMALRPLSVWERTWRRAWQDTPGLCGIAGSHIYSSCCLLAQAILITGNCSVKFRVTSASRLSLDFLHQFCAGDRFHLQVFCEVWVGLVTSTVLRCRRVLCCHRHPPPMLDSHFFKTLPYNSECYLQPWKGTVF